MLDNEKNQVETNGEDNPKEDKMASAAPAPIPVPAINLAKIAEQMQQDENLTTEIQILCSSSEENKTLTSSEVKARLKKPA
jgi:hypothetical protein